ncbi:hypothetical protein DV738_g1054, partial [Chaetothyriales sp. CBS 135597]
MTSLLAGLFGWARLSYYHAAQSLQLTIKNGGGTVTLAELCKSVIPPCRLNPLLFNGHLHTVWTILSGNDVAIYYKRRLFEQEDPVYHGTFAVDFVVSPNKDSDTSLPQRTTYFTDYEFDNIGSDDDRPMLVALHGLSGGSDELYLRETLGPLVELGWEACVVNSRGCAMSKLTSTVLYNARATWDVRQVVKWLRKTFPNRPLFGIGFSLGANIITNYVGEEGADCPLLAAVALSNPWNLEVGSLALRRTWIHSMYHKTLAQNMTKVFVHHFDQLSNNPNLDLDKILTAKDLCEFDRYVQCPTWGYPTEGAYYRDASSVDALLGIRIPFLGISAEDDPVASVEALPYEEAQVTPYVVLCTTNLGGHLGWFEIGGGRWFSTAIANFFQKLAKDVQLDGYSRTELSGQISLDKRQSLKPVFNPTGRKLPLYVD